MSNRFLDPDPELLRESANAVTNPKFHALNGALVQLVSLDLRLSTSNELTLSDRSTDRGFQYGAIPPTRRDE